MDECVKKFSVLSWPALNNGRLFPEILSTGDLAFRNPDGCYWDKGITISRTEAIKLRDWLNENVKD